MQSGAQPDTPHKPVLKPPSLAHFVDPVYPEAAFDQGLEAKVVVELLVNAEGRVAEAKVVQGAGHGFDEAALTAARQLTFNPATSDDKPIPARIHFPFVFEIRQQAEEIAPEVLPARFEGSIRSTDDDQGIAGASISLTAIEGDLSGQTVSEADGRFFFEEVPAGSYRVLIEANGYLPAKSRETLTAGQALEAVYRLEPAEDAEGFGAVARIPPPPREVTRHTINRTQLTRIPGTRGDALRAIELMPGVARPPLGVGALIVRGSAPQDSMAMLDGLPVPLLYHFGGLTSFINSRMLDRIDFYPGNFSVRYGRRRGGIVEVKTRMPNKEHFAGVLDANLIDASVLLESPITDNLQVAAAARRSHVDVILANALPDDVDVIAAPVYYDYQALATYQPSDHDRLRLLVFGSSDELALLFEDTGDALTTGNFGLRTSFNRAQLSWEHKAPSGPEYDVQFSTGDINFRFGAGQIHFDLKGMEIYGRGEAHNRITDHVSIITGLDIFAIPGQLTYNGPAVQQQGQNPNNQPGSNTATANRDFVKTDSEFTVFQPAMFVESELDLAPMRVVLGSRLDYDNATNTFAFDPRASAHLALTDNLNLRGGIGMFSQPPDFPESNKDLGNPDLSQSRTTHLTLGAAYQMAESVFVAVDGFYKHLTNVVVGTQFGDAPFFTNDGKGRIYGAEFSARVEPTGRFFGYLSYTLSRSERSIRGGPYQLFDFDQPHILTLSGTYRLGAGWEAGATFRLVSGNPYTPIVGASQDSGTGAYTPFYGPLNSRRNPAFHRVDVRVEKRWKFEDWALALYVDVQNAYNSVNPQGFVYSYDYSQKNRIRGIPIFPNMGIRGEM